MPKFSRIYFAFLLAALLAVAGNAVFPFALHPDAPDGKILICTADGFRYVEAQTLPKIPENPHKPNCLLCTLAAVNPPVTPTSTIAFTVSLKQFTALAWSQENCALPRVAHTLFISRAPPALS